MSPNTQTSPPPRERSPGSKRSARAHRLLPGRGSCSAVALDGLAICLLDLSPEAQGARLAARGDDPALLHHHQAFAEWMRRHANDPLHMTHVLSADGWDEMRWDRLAALAPAWRMVRIDTTAMTRDGVADAVLEWCRQALGGEAPVIRCG